jgi:hypothetical protein
MGAQAQYDPLGSLYEILTRSPDLSPSNIYQLLYHFLSKLGANMFGKVLGFFAVLALCATDLAAAHIALESRHKRHVP